MRTCVFYNSYPNTATPFKTYFQYPGTEMNSLWSTPLTAQGKESNPSLWTLHGEAPNSWFSSHYQYVTIAALLSLYNYPYVPIAVLLSLCYYRYVTIVMFLSL